MCFVIYTKGYLRTYYHFQESYISWQRQKTTLMFQRTSPAAQLHLPCGDTNRFTCDLDNNNNDHYKTNAPKVITVTPRARWRLKWHLYVCSTASPGADQGKHQNSASLPFVCGIHRWPVDSPHKWPVTWKMFNLMPASWQSWLWERDHVNPL